jgi:hypothetical protein
LYVLYVDESGRSGLFDQDQPYHILGGLAFHDSQWKAIESALIDCVDALVPPPRPPGWELHMAHIFHGKGHFREMPRDTREALVDCVIDLFGAFDITLFMMVINKSRLISQYAYPAPPPRLAYEFMIERFDRYLSHREDQVGMIVSDDQKGEERTIRAAHEAYRRGGTSQQPIHNVIETPFFVPSHNSWMIQIVDVATFWCNRWLKNHPGPPPREWTRLEPHLDRSATGDPNGYGYKLFPL